MSCTDIGDPEIDLIAGSSCAVSIECVIPEVMSVKSQQSLKSKDLKLPSVHQKTSNKRDQGNNAMEILR